MKTSIYTLILEFLKKNFNNVCISSCITKSENIESKTIFELQKMF